MVEEKIHNEFPEPSNTGLILRAIERISSLISISHSIKVFSGKWQFIRHKLEELLASLNAFENYDSGNNPILSATIQAIFVTVKDSNNMAKTCLDLSYSGKLLMQSDLDMLSERFNTHIKSLSEIYTDGVLTNNYAIVVSRPGPAASGDDMKFYVQDLLSRFRIGGMDMKKQALVAFNEMVGESEDAHKYVKISMEVDGIISVFLNFLDSQEIEVQEEAAKALSVISGFESCRIVLVSAGVIAPLVQVLEAGSDLGKEFATRCLQNVTENSNNVWSVSAHGGVTALLKICSTMCDYRGELVGLACGVLKNLVVVEEIKRFMVEEDSIPMLINLAKSKNEVSQINAIDLLQIMASRDEIVMGLIFKEGGIRVLVRVLDPKSSSSNKVREMTIRAIVNLCSNGMGNLSCLMNYGFMDHILYFLRNGEVSVQEMSLKTAFWLCGTSEEAKKAMGDAGFMPELVKFLNAKSFEVREMAAETLYSLVLLPRNRKKFVQNDQSVGLVLQMVDPEEGNSGNRKLLLSIIMSLTSSNSGRRKIVSSCYLKNIEKLAEAQVSDAKKIVRNLSTNRFRSILRGIWHS